MTNTELIEFFRDKAWFDNSRIKMIRGCRRKAYYQLIGPAGLPLSGKVGDGANFGSSIHAGLARYYQGWGNFDESIRRAHAARAFTEEWQLYFPHDHIQTKHRLDRGLEILGAYFDHYLAEDSLYEPVEAELGFAVEITPLIGSPFYYVGRIDGIFKRLATGELFLRETKTTGQTTPNAIEKRLRQLKFDHQPIGYTWCVRHLAGEQRQAVSGVMGDIIGVASQSFGFARDYFPITANQAESWHRQLINTVEDWRALCAKLGNPLDNFYQDTERCFDFGKCSFYELCDYGITHDSLQDFEENTWNPLTKRTPKRIEVA